MTNWDLINKKDVKSLILWHKGTIKVIFDTEFLLVPRKDWFYCYNFMNFVGRNIPVSRSIGFKCEKGVRIYTVIEKTGRIIFNERKF